jgi:superfamily II DNA or RNA helicase
MLAPGRNHILALTIRAVTLHLKTTDTFNGKPVVSFRPPVMQMQKHKLTDKEAETQQLTRMLWDPKLQAVRKQSGSGLNRHETLPAIQNARRALVHPECANFHFGESHKRMIKKASTEEGEGDPDNHQILSALEEQIRKELKLRTKGAWHSTRIDIVVEAIKQRLKDEPLHKILIFDEFLSTLDVVANALEELEIAHLRYDASIRPDVRAASLAAFQNPSDLNAMVMLCTIQCAGVGLNLATARTVVILAPGWNPALEKQAICRANRIGQTGNVWVYNFKVIASIERRIYMLRKRKENKFGNLFDPGKLNSKRLDDIKGWSMAQFRQHVGKSSTTIGNMKLTLSVV